MSRLPWLVASWGALAVSVHAAEPAFFQARVAPIFERHCSGCHGETKQKAGLRLDSYAAALLGGESGAAIKAGDVKGSDAFRRITLPHDDEEFMPSDGKPALSKDEIKIIELWIAAGASATQTLADFPGAPVGARPRAATIALAPDWRPRAAEVAKLERALGLRLVARSHVPTDGLVVRTASAPARCTDETLAQLAPVADLIVEAELARTKITNVGLTAIAGWPNLRFIDLSRTPVTSDGTSALQPLAKLEIVNLTATKVDAAGVAQLKALPAVRQVWAFGTPAMPEEKSVVESSGAAK